MKKNKKSNRDDKSIDCVAMKNKIQKKIYEDIKGMSLAEENEYREKKIVSSSLSEMWKRLKSKSKKEKKTAV